MLRSARSARENIHQLGDLATLIRRISARDRVLDAMSDMITQHLFLDAAKRGADGRDLGHDIDAIPPLLHHFGEAADLAFDAVQPLEASCFRLLLHVLTYTPWGYICQIGYPSRVWA
jgi:hypothetical protein